LRNHDFVQDIRGSEVTFNEEAVSRRTKMVEPKVQEDSTAIRVRALFEALKEV